MTIYYVDRDATGTNDGTSWTNAWTSLGSAFTNVTTAGDVIYISHTHNEQLAANATYTAGAAHVNSNILKIYSVNKTNDALAIGAFIGHDSLSRSITIVGRVYIYGLTLKVAGGSAENIVLNNSSAASLAVFESCTFHLANTSSGVRISIGGGSTEDPGEVILKGCSFAFGHTLQRIVPRNSCIEMSDCVISSGSTHPTYAFAGDVAPSVVRCYGCDLSNIANILSSAGDNNQEIFLVQCKLKTGFALISGDVVGGFVTALDCSDGDNHYLMGYQDYQGTLQMDTGIYCNDNIADTDLSWKIVSTANASMMTPFVSPWISVYHSGTSAITPYLEILRSGSSTAFTDAEVWAEWMYKGTSGSTRATIANDRCAALGTPANQTASSKTASDWTGENATSWFGKIGPSASITPAEAGDLSFRICVGAASTTVYVCPQIRGLA